MTERERLRQALHDWERRFTDCRAVSVQDLAVMKQRYWMTHGVEPLKDLIREVTLEVAGERKEERRAVQMRKRNRSLPKNV